MNRIGIFGGCRWCALSSRRGCDSGGGTNANQAANLAAGAQRVDIRDNAIAVPGRPRHRTFILSTQ